MRRFRGGSVATGRIAQIAERPHSMNRTVLRRLAALLVALAVVAVVGVVAYQVGTGNTAGSHPMMRGTTFRGFGEGMGYVPGIGLLGLLGLVVVGLLVFWLLTTLVTPNRGGPGPAAATTGDLERLRELSDLHTAGKLTDEEFTVAKRKVLGLQ
jgi:hypothetical protein